MAQARKFSVWLGLTTGQTASHCQASLPASKPWIQAGRLTAGKPPGGLCRLDLEEPQRFLRQDRMFLYAASTPYICILIIDDTPSIVDSKDEELRTISQQLWQVATLATMGELAASIAHA